MEMINVHTGCQGSFLVEGGKKTAFNPVHIYTSACALALAWTDYIAQQRTLHENEIAIQNLS